MSDEKKQQITPRPDTKIVTGSRVYFTLVVRLTNWIKSVLRFPWGRSRALEDYHIVHKYNKYDGIAAVAFDRLEHNLPELAPKQVYENLRTAALELREQGHNGLGATLYEATGRFLSSLSMRFEDVQTFMVVHYGERLRWLYEAHRVAKIEVFDDNRLEPLIAMQLGELVQLYDFFAISDDRMRALTRTMRSVGGSGIGFGETILLVQLKKIVADSGQIEGFDAAKWLATWLREPLPALGGVTPLSLLDTTEGYEQVSNVLARMQSGAYA